MHVEVGPLPTASAQVWLEYARGVVAEVEQEGGRIGRRTVEVAPDVVAAFHRYLAEWQEAADAGGDFRWTADVEPEMVEYLLHAWFKVAAATDERARRRGLAAAVPDAARPFYHGLVLALLDALTAEGHEPTAAFAEELRAFWPGLGGTEG